MNDREVKVLMTIKNVDFEQVKGVSNIGSFSLIENQPNSFLLIWEADMTKNRDDCNTKNALSHIKVSMDQVSDIIRRDISYNQVSLRLVLVDSSRLPRFSFYSMPHILVTHFLQYLVHRKVLSEGKKKNNFKVTHISTRTEEDIFGYILPSELPPQLQVNIIAHNKVLNILKFQPLYNSQEPVTINDLKGLSFDCAKKRICAVGIKPSDRPLIYPYLLEMYPYTNSNEDIYSRLKEQLREYRNIHKQYSLITEFQKLNSSLLQDINHVIDNDVKRNDRNLEQFMRDDHPNLLLLKHVLTAYAMWNRDTGYVQGMADLVTPLILLYITDWAGETAIFFDGSKKSMEEAESFIFWNFVGLMKVTQHERLFTEIGDHQKFVLERASVIASSVHHPLEELLKSEDLTELSFLFRPLLLLFKREFKTDELYRLWDAILTSSSPPIYTRFIAAAIIILAYPKLLLHTNGTIGEVMNVLDGTMEKTEVTSVIQLANTLIEKITPNHPKYNFIYSLIPEKSNHKNFKSKYFQMT